MGRLVQKILQGRGKQKGTGNRITGLLLPLFLLIAYVGVVLDVPPIGNLPWFCLVCVIAAIYSFLCFVKKVKGRALEAYLAYGILISSVIRFFDLKGLHIIYIPYVFLLSLFVQPSVVIPLSIAIPFLELRHLINGNALEEILLSLTSISIGIVLSILMTSVKKQRDDYRTTLEKIKAEASFFSGTLNEEGLLSQHLSTIEETDREIKNLLDILIRILPFRAVGFFSLENGNYGFRCLAPEGGLRDLGVDDIIKKCIDGGGMPFISGSSSVIAYPVREGNSIIGIIVAEGNDRFSPSHMERLGLFSEQISMIIKKERINRIIKRDQLGLRLLNEGSSRLNSSLDMKALSLKMIEAMYEVAQLKILFFIPEKPSGRNVRFELFNYLGIVDPEDKVFDLRNTIVGNYIESREPVYISDLRGNKTPVLPFKIGSIRSFLILPLLYENETLGLLLFVSEKINALSSYQINLLRILGNQASTAFANARLYAEIQRMAITDGLTGLYNHKHFQERLSAELSRSSRYAKNLSLLLIDIDHFKKINDRYGHPAGDDVLKAVAGIMMETIRSIDIAARYGGEEFAVVLPDTDENGAMKMADRLRTSIMKHRFSFDGKGITVTVSVGLAVAPTDAKTKEELILRADEALYQAKEKGRNRCISWRNVRP